MIGTEYKIAAAETISVLNNMNTIDVKRIPQSFLDFLVSLSSEEDKPELDYNKPIEELNLKEKTREILGYIYINWWSTKEEKDLCKKMIDNKRKNSIVSTNIKYDVNNLHGNYNYVKKCFLLIIETTLKLEMETMLMLSTVLLLKLNILNYQQLLKLKQLLVGAQN